MIWILAASVLAAAPAAEAAPATTGPQGGSAPAAAPAPPPPPAGAAPTDAEKKKLEEEIAKELGATPGGTAQTPAPPAAAPAPAAPQASAPGAGQPQGQTGGNPYARLLMLPDISAIGSGALAWNHLDVAQVSPRSEDLAAPPGKVQPIFQELEVGLQAVVDPYARADVFLTFDPGGAGVEEAYVTTLSLPASLQARAGELYAPFGRLNQQHPHTWDFVDRPLALSRLLAVDGLRGPGLDVSWLAPTPWFAELHLAYQAVAPAFDPESHVAGLARLLQYFDLGEATTLGVGLSGTYVDQAGVDASRQVLGGDLFLKIRPPQGRSYLALQGEAIVRRLNGQELHGGPGDGSPPEPPGTEVGGYVQALWRDGAYLAYGLRYENAPATGGREDRASALLSWMPSEFERLRLQVSYDRLPGGLDGLEALLHMEFIIGAHGAHPF